MPHYHLSYDFDEKLNDDTFNNYDEAREYLLCVLTQFPSYVTMYEYCESTLIIEVSNTNKHTFFNYIKPRLEPYFYYFVSEISTSTNGNLYINSNKNEKLNKSLQKELKDLDCSI